MNQGPKSWLYPLIALCVTLARILIQKSLWDFPGGPVVKNPPCNIWDMGSILGQGTKIPHVAQFSQKKKNH